MTVVQERILITLKKKLTTIINKIMIKNKIFIFRQKPAANSNLKMNKIITLINKIKNFQLKKIMMILILKLQLLSDYYHKIFEGQEFEFY